MKMSNQRCSTNKRWKRRMCAKDKCKRTWQTLLSVEIRNLPALTQSIVTFDFVTLFCTILLPLGKLEALLLVAIKLDFLIMSDSFLYICALTFNILSSQVHPSNLSIKNICFKTWSNTGRFGTSVRLWCVVFLKLYCERGTWRHNS